MDIKVPRKFKKDSAATNNSNSDSQHHSTNSQDHSHRPSSTTGGTEPVHGDSGSDVRTNGNSGSSAAWALLRIIENLGPYEPPGSDEVCRIIANFLNNVRPAESGAIPTLEDIKEFLAATMALRFERVTIDDYISYTAERGSISNLNKQKVVDLLPPKPQIVKFGELRVSLQNYFAIDLKPLYSVLCKLVDRLYDRLVELGVLLEDAAGTTAASSHNEPSPPPYRSQKSDSKSEQSADSRPHRDNRDNNGPNGCNTTGSSSHFGSQVRFPNGHDKRSNTSNNKSNLYTGTSKGPPTSSFLSSRQDWPNRNIRGVSPDMTNSDNKFRDKFSSPQLRRLPGTGGSSGGIGGTDNNNNMSSDNMSGGASSYRRYGSGGDGSKRQMRSSGGSSSGGGWRAAAAESISPTSSSRSPLSGHSCSKGVKREYSTDDYMSGMMVNPPPIHPSSRMSPAEYFREGRARRDRDRDLSHLSDEPENTLHRKGTSDALINSVCSGKKRVGEKLTQSYKGLGVKTTWFCKKTNAWITTFELDVDDSSSDEESVEQSSSQTIEDGRRTRMSTKQVIYDPAVWGGFDEARNAAENFEFKIDKGVQINNTGDCSTATSDNKLPSGSSCGGKSVSSKPMKRSRRNSSSGQLLVMPKIPSISGWKPPLEWNPFSHCSSCSCADQTGLPIHCRTCMCSDTISSRHSGNHHHHQFKRVAIKNSPDIGDHCFSGHCQTEKSPWQRSFSTLLQVDN